MTKAAKELLRNGEILEWEDGNLVCIKKTNGKFRLSVRNSRSIIRNENNKWIFKEDFDYVSKPDQYILIVRKNENSRLINLLQGVYITEKTYFVKEKVGKYSYLVTDLTKNIDLILNLKRLKL